MTEIESITSTSQLFFTRVCKIFSMLDSESIENLSLLMPSLFDRSDIWYSVSSQEIYIIFSFTKLPS